MQKEADRYREIRNWNNSLRRTHFKSQPTSRKSGPSVNFGQSHRIVDFHLDVGQHLLNPAPQKKTAVYCCFGCGKASHSSRIVKVTSSAKWLADSDFNEFSERGKAELDTRVSSVSWIRGHLHRFLKVWHFIGPLHLFLALLKVVISYLLFRFQWRVSLVIIKALLIIEILSVTLSSNCCWRVAQWKSNLTKFMFAAPLVWFLKRMANFHWFLTFAFLTST